MLVTPSPEDWLMYSRTYDAQRFSPLEFINRRNVPQLKSAWTKALPNGNHESIPIVYAGVMYLVQPGASVRRARTRATATRSGSTSATPRRRSRTKTLAIYRDLVYYTAPDGFIVALDAKTGEVRWETKTDGGMTSGPVVVEGKVLTGRTCADVAEELLHLRARRDDRRGSLEVLHRRRRRRSGRRELGAARRSDSASPRPGGLPGSYDPAAQADLLGRREPDAEHARWNATAASPTRFRTRRRPICTAIRPSR